MPCSCASLRATGTACLLSSPAAPSLDGRDVLARRADECEHLADRDGLARAVQDGEERARHRGLDLERRLVGLDLEQELALLDARSTALEPLRIRNSFDVAPSGGMRTGRGISRRSCRITA